MSKIERLVTCCFCGTLIAEDRGNNPYPVDKNPNHYCCEMCNLMKVIPERIRLMTEKEIHDGK